MVTYRVEHTCEPSVREHNTQAAWAGSCIVGNFETECDTRSLERFCCRTDSTFKEQALTLGVCSCLAVCNLSSSSLCWERFVKVAATVEVHPTTGKAPLQAVVEVSALDGHCYSLSLLNLQYMVKSLCILCTVGNRAVCRVVKVLCSTGCGHRGHIALLACNVCTLALVIHLAHTVVAILLFLLGESTLGCAVNLYPLDW